MTVDSADVSAGRKAELRKECDRLLTELRRGRVPDTLAEVAEWEREFGPNRTPIERVTMCRRLARRFGVPYREVEAAVPWMFDDGVVA